MGFIKVKLLDEENYSKYGKLLVKKPVAPDVDREYLKYWHDLYDIDISGEKTIGFLEILRQEFVVDRLERHITGPEVFKLNHGAGVMAFAPGTDVNDPDSVPNRDEIDVFILDGSLSLTINTGVWHFPPLPITPSMGIFVIAPKQVSDDIDMKCFEPINILL